MTMESVESFPKAFPSSTTNLLKKLFRAWIKYLQNEKNQRVFWVLLRKLKLQKREIQIHAVNQMSNKDTSKSYTQKQYASCWTVNSISLSGSHCLFEMFYFIQKIQNIYEEYKKLYSEGNRKVVNLFYYSNPLYVFRGHLLRMAGRDSGDHLVHLPCWSRFS